MNTEIEAQPQTMPDPAFVASLATNPGRKLRSARALDNHRDPILEKDGLTDLVAETTPLKDANYAHLYAYMIRRFGYPQFGGDSAKDLSGRWLLTTPERDIYVQVSPSLNGVVFNFQPVIAIVDDDELSWEKLARSELERVAAAYRTVLLDLLRPVSVRDSWINAMGIVDDDSELLAGDEEQPFIAPYEPTSTRGVPRAVIEGEAWWSMIAVINHLGGGDISTGRSALLTLGRQAIFEEFRCQNLDVRLLASLGIGDGWEGLLFDAERDVYLDGGPTPDLAERRERMKREIVAPVAGDGASVEALITSDMIAKAVPLIRVLNPKSFLPQQLSMLQANRRLSTEWTALAHIVGSGEFPDSCIPQRLDVKSLAELPDALDREGAAELAAWARRLTAEKDGLAVVFKIMLHLQMSSQRAKPSAPKP